MPDASLDPSGSPTTERKRPRRRTVIALAAVAAGFLGLGLGPLPFWLIRAGERQAARCVEAAQAGEELDPHRCVVNARGFFSLPALLPWTSGRVPETGAADEQAALQLGLDVATAIRPDARRREAAARALAATVASPSDADVSAASLLDTGALDGIYPWPVSGVNPLRWFELSHGFQGARARGDLAAAFLRASEIEVMAAGASNAIDRSASSCRVDVQALRCLAGQPAEGAKGFAGASCCNGDMGCTEQKRAVQLGSATCTPSARVPAAAPLPDRALIGLIGGGAGAVTLADLEGLAGPERLPLAAAALLAATAPDAAEAAALFAGREVRSDDFEPDRKLRDPLAWPQPDCSGFTGAQLCVLPPELLARAADRLDAIAEAAPASLPEVFPKGNPPAELRKLAFAARAYAAMEWLHRGNPQRARALVPTSLAAPSLPWASVRTRILLGASDGEGALRSARQALAFEPNGSATRALMLLHESLALVALGRMEEAWQAARRADETIATVSVKEISSQLQREFEVPGRGSGRVEAARVRLRLLRLALARKLGRTDEPPPLVAVQGHERLAALLALLALPEPARRSGRVALARASESRAPDLVTAADMYLVGEAVRDAGDVEVWLDRIFARVMREGSRDVMHARAEAARLRGDPAAAELWETRRLAYEKLIVDDRTAVLARIAGL